jgi:hypothetical protein
MTISEIKQRVINKLPVTTEQYLELLRNDEPTFWAFLISNNPGNINNTLRHRLKEPYTELGFEPNQAALARTIEMIIQQGNEPELMEVLRYFELKPEGLDPVFVEVFTAEFLD